MMAIRVLLEHDVPEENIILLSLLMAEAGVHQLAYAFPRVTLVTTAVDPHISGQYYVIPGLGNFGDRYYGSETISKNSTDDEFDCEEGNYLSSSSLDEPATTEKDIDFRVDGLDRICVQ